MFSRPKIHFVALLGMALRTQLSVVLGMSLCLCASYAYLFIDDARYPKEQPWMLWVGLLLASLCVFAGMSLSRKKSERFHLSLRDGSVVVLLSWAIAVSISAVVLTLAGVPIPSRADEFSLFRRFIDAVFESVSGFTTAGGSILPSVEAFPRSILLWRSVTHLLGGMGMTYLAVTLFVRFPGARQPLLNAEAEGPNEIRFTSEEQARRTGFEFMKVYGLLTAALAALLFASGFLTKSGSYAHTYDNAFDAVNHAFSVMGTGGFGVYDESVGLPVATDSGVIIGGLENPGAEWIITAFMLIAGSNFSLWYVLFFRSSQWKSVFRNQELKVYAVFVSVMTVGIWFVLVQHSYYSGGLESLRYALFNVATIISTTGLGNANFHLWPGAAIGLLFLVYFVGGMVGSTSGGLKILRFMILYKFVMLHMRNFLFGRHITRFKIDDTTYDMKSAGLVVANIMLYYVIFMLGAIGIMMTSPVGVLPDGTVRNIDLITGITVSIANLGNIGPTAALGSIDAGPTGNYFAFSVWSKLIMCVLMLVGRLGVFTFFVLLINKAGLRHHEQSMAVQKFDADKPHLKM